jgi:hypothetical protein
MALSLGIVGFEIYAIATGALSQEEAIAKSGIAHHKMFWLLTILPLLWFIAEAITMLTNEKSRALHDYIAGTVVVRTNAN